jgi:hypothetical protein
MEADPYGTNLIPHGLADDVAKSFEYPSATDRAIGELLADASRT